MGGIRRGVVAVAVALTVVTGSALSVGAVESKAKKPKKPVAACKLLTDAELTQTLGAPPIKPAKSDSVDECDLSSAADYNFINIMVRPLVSVALWKQQALGSNANIPVTGIGDAAYRSADNATILVRKGKKTLRIDQYVTGLTEAQIESLGKAATARL